MSKSSRQILLLLVGLVGLAVLLAVAPLTNIPFWAIDLYTFRAAAKAMMLGADPYNVANIPRFADGVEVGNIHNYLYAPYFAFALRPLAWISPEAASRVWFALNMLLYFISTGLLVLALRWSPKPQKILLLIVGIIVFPPLRTTLIIGQSTILLLFVLALSLFLLRQRRPVASGLVFSLGLFKPHLFPLILFFLFYRQWRWLIGVGAGLVILNLPLMGWLDNWVASAVATRAANLAVDQCFQMVSLIALLNCTLPWASWVNLVFLGVLALAVLLVAWLITTPAEKSLRNEDRVFDRRLAVFLTLCLLLIDHTRIADQILLLFPLLVIWRDWNLLKTTLTRWIAVFLIGIIYLLPYMLDYLGPKNIAYLLPFWYIGLSGAVLGLLFLEWMGRNKHITS